MKYKILYVDDEEINLRLFQATFKRDFEIITVNSAQKALDFLEKEIVDVVITDQRMPVMTGVQLLKEINGRFSDIPPQRLMISGYTEDSEIKKAFEEYKLYNFISKPWKYDELKAIIIRSIEDYK